MAVKKRMDQIRNILKSYVSNGHNVKVTARVLGISKNTVKEYVRRAQGHCADVGAVLGLDDERLYELMYKEEGQQTDVRQKVIEDNCAKWIIELGKVGVTRSILWAEYRQEYPDGYSYSQFCEYLSRYAARRDLTLALEHRAGEVMMADFSGKKLSWVDRDTGEWHACEVLIVVMPFSQHTFCIALPSQKIADFIHGLNEALRFFGAVPQVLLSDNLKSYVSKPDRYEPTFTQLCGQMGAHYQFDLQATRVRRPRDKASVENAVEQIYRRVFAPLRHTRFHSLEQLNTAILEHLHQHNEQDFQKKAGSRRLLFEQYELPQMRPLPPEVFEVKKITSAKIQRNYHIFLGEEKNFYSVPWQYAGRQSEVLYTRNNVEVYVDGKRIAVHSRLAPNSLDYRYQTREEHMPKNHQEWKKAQGYDAAYFLKQAAGIGPNTHEAVRLILQSRIQEAQTFNACKGILHLAKTYSAERLENAAKRCLTAGKATYSMLKKVLQLKLDQVGEETQAEVSFGFHKNIRGPQHYQ